MKKHAFFSLSANISLKIKKKFYFLGSVPVPVLTRVVVTSLDSSMDCKEKVKKKEINVFITVFPVTP